MFAGRIYWPAAKAGQARRRRIIHNSPTPLREHLSNLVFHTEPDAFKVDIHEAIPIRFGELMQRSAHSCAGVVEGAVQSAVRGHCFVHQRLDLHGPRHIRSDKEGLATSLIYLLYCLLSLVRAACRNDDLGPCLGERDGRSFAYPGVATRNQCDLAME